MNDLMKLEHIKGGGVLEMANREIQRIANDIADPNKLATGKRTLVITLEFAPTEDAKYGTLTASVKSTLAKQQDMKSTLFFGWDENTRQGIASENNIPSLPLTVLDEQEQ